MSIKNTLTGRYCVCRFYSAGVHAGIVDTIEQKNGTFDVLLRHARRLWRWDAKQGAALSGVAQHGLKPGCIVDVENPIIAISQCIEIIQCSESAEKSIRKFGR